MSEQLYRRRLPDARIDPDIKDYVWGLVDRALDGGCLVPVEPDLDAMVDALNGLTAEDLPHVEWHQGAAQLLWEAATGQGDE